MWVCICVRVRDFSETLANIVRKHLIKLIEIIV